MIKISLSDFINFTAKSGTPRQTEVRDIRNRKPYLKKVDYWHEVRESIYAFHADNTLSKDYFDVVMHSHRFIKVVEPTKIENCKDRLQKYKKFVGRKQITMNKIVKCDWQYKKDLIIRVNPEVHASINGETYLLKLYFKSGLLDKRRTEACLYLIKKATEHLDLKVDYYGLLEVYRPKLWKDAMPSDSVEPYLFSELDAFISMYNNPKL